MIKNHLARADNNPNVRIQGVGVKCFVQDWILITITQVTLSQKQNTCICYDSVEVDTSAWPCGSLGSIRKQGKHHIVGVTTWLSTIDS